MFQVLLPSTAGTHFLSGSLKAGHADALGEPNAESPPQAAVVPLGHISVLNSQLGDSQEETPSQLKTPHGLPHMNKKLTTLK